MNFLKKLFASKKENSEKKKQLLLSMPLFKGNQAYSLDQVVQELKSHWGLQVSEVSGDDSNATFLIDGALVALALMDLPIPSQEFEKLYAYSYLWQDVEKEIQEHSQHAIVSIMSDNLSPVETYSLLTKVNSSILKTSQSAIGIYQGSTTLLLPKDLYLDLADLLKEEMLPLQLWIYMGIIDQEDKTSIYTYGLKEFGKAEIEIIDSPMNSDDLYFFLLSILQYVLGSDITLNDGETIGFSEDQKIKITESKAVYLEGNSLKLDV